jgi:(p)ppGpp synthase/HD superfamily hydrolase
MLCGIGIIATTAGFLAESFLGRPPRPRLPQRSTRRPVIGREFERAIDYAMDVHGYDVRGREARPFIAHTLSVAALVLEDGGSQDEAIAALLHDAPEGVTTDNVPSVLAGIRSSFGDAVVHIVERCSGPASGPSWREQRGHYLEGLETESDVRVLRVALAKELDNARMLRRDLAKYGDRAWAGDHSTADDMRWYYGALSRINWQSIGSPMVAELREALAVINAADPSRVR